MSRAVAVMLPVHKREKVAQIASKCLQRVLSELAEANIQSRVLVVGNEAWAEKMAADKGWHYLKANNSSVGHKFDTGARWMVDKWGLWATHFMEFCSDNIVSDDFVKFITPCILEDRHHCVTTNAFYMLNAETQEVRLFHTGVGSNVGRLTRMSIVRKMRDRGDGRIFDHGLKKGLDRSFRMKMQSVSGKRPILHKIATPYIIDVKDKDSMNGWQSFASKPDKFPLVEIEGNFQELHNLTPQWQQQAKLGATPSTSTSAPPQEPTPSTTRQATTPTTSSQAQPAAPSAASSKRSTRQRKTTTAPAPSSSQPSTGQSAAKVSSTTATTPTKSAPTSSSTSGTTRRKSASRGPQASTAMPSTTETATSPATKKAQDSTKSPASASPSKATAASRKPPSTPPRRPSTTRSTKKGKRK